MTLIKSHTVFLCALVITLSVFLSFFTGHDFSRNFVYFYAYSLILGSYFLRRFIQPHIIVLFIVFFVTEECLLGNYRAIAECSIRPFGIIGNPNPSSALLLLGTVFFISSGKFKFAPIAGLALATMILSGSRATFLVSLPIMALLLFKYPKLTAISLMIGLLAFMTLTLAVRSNCDSKPNALNTSVKRIIGITSGTDAQITEATARVKAPFSIIPRGEIDSSNSDTPMHNVPFRYAYTYGIASMLAWFVVMSLCLTRGIWSWSWWLILAIFGLSWLDYYWIEPYFLLPFSWLIFIYHSEVYKKSSLSGLIASLLSRDKIAVA